MNRHTFNRIATGLAIVAIGVLAFLGSLSIINFGELAATWWPLVIIGAGLLMLINNPRQFAWPLLIILAGVLWQLQQFQLVTFNVFSLFWPAVIVAIGFSVIKGAAPRKKTSSHKDFEEINAILGGNQTENRSRDYKGGKSSAIFGGVTLDLRQAKITDEATLNVFVLCGGIEIKVPEDWAVNVHVTPVLGGVENKSDTVPAKNAPTLTIAGDLIMGGIEIKR